MPSSCQPGPDNASRYVCGLARSAAARRTRLASTPRSRPGHFRRTRALAALTLGVIALVGTAVRFVRHPGRVQHGAAAAASAGTGRERELRLRPERPPGRQAGGCATGGRTATGTAAATWS